MVGLTKVLLFFTLFLGAVSVDVRGGRILKVDQPQTFGSIGGAFPNPGFTGTFPNPGLGGSSFPNPGFGGSSFPNPGSAGGSFPNPGLGFGHSTFCSYHGVYCPKVQSNSPAGSKSGASVDVSGSP